MTTARPIIGVDPGLGGALAYLAPGRHRVYAMPTVTIKRGRTEKRRIDAAKAVQICEALAALDPVAVYFEDVGGLPGQSAPASFAFGQGAGIIEGIFHALRVPVIMVHAATWKDALRVPAGKDGARAIASRLMPTAAHLWPLAKDDGKAEASLIALWGSLHGTLR